MVSALSKKTAENSSERSCGSPFNCRNVVKFLRNPFKVFPGNTGLGIISLPTASARGSHRIPYIFFPPNRLLEVPSSPEHCGRLFNAAPSFSRLQTCRRPFAEPSPVRAPIEDPLTPPTSTVCSRETVVHLPFLSLFRLLKAYWII